MLKGGHLRGNEAADVFVAPGGEARKFTAPFIPGVATHGTGCTYSAAITAGLAKGLPLDRAIAEAKEFVSQCHRGSISNGLSGGASTAALNHFLPAGDR